MTAPTALSRIRKEGHDRNYRLDHVVTKTILKAFNMDAVYVKNRAESIS